MAGQGFCYVPDYVKSGIGLHALDDSIPSIDDRGSAEPWIVLSARRRTHLSQDFIVTISGVWPDGQDEFGRAGMTYSHLLLCRIQRHLDSFLGLAGVLVGLLTLYRREYHVVGNCLQMLASESERGPDLLASLCARTAARPTREFPESYMRAVARFIVNVDRLPPRVNVRPSFPLDPLAAVPFLLAALVWRDDIRSVAFGRCSLATTSQCELVSRVYEVPGYFDCSLSSLLQNEVGRATSYRSLSALMMCSR